MGSGREELILTDGEAVELAEKFGTPLYVLDEEVLRLRVRRWKRSFESVCPDGVITYASKANSTLALLKIVWQEGCGIDVASEGELRAAQAAGIPPKDCHFHGNSKTIEELEYAISQGIGQIVVDSFEEIRLLSGLPGPLPPLLLRLAPGVQPLTHEKISVGKNDTKFGFNMGDGQAERALLECLGRGFPVAGFHCHVGSQLLDPGAQIDGGRALADFARRMKDEHGFVTQVLNVGGGMGVSSPGKGSPMPFEDYCRILVESVREFLEGSGLNPRLVQEPGRSIAAPAGVTLYRVGVVKEAPLGEGRTRTFVSVTGGMADNPRPALYGASYALQLTPAARERGTKDRVCTVAGRHCENDILFPDVLLDEGVRAGDVLQVFGTGAYNSSMSSRYNRYPRPATVLRRLSGEWQVVQRRETWDDLLASEQLPQDL